LYHALAPNGITPSSIVLKGRVSLGEHEDRSSDYVAEFGKEGELALDANRIGNEARFVNDFRNTGEMSYIEI